MSGKNGVLAFDYAGGSAGVEVFESPWIRASEIFRVGPKICFGRFAWYQLMRVCHEPWPERWLEPDADYPRDSAP